MAKSQTVLQRKDTTSNSALYISFDLGDKNWQLSLGDDRFHVSRHAVAAGDTAAVASLILKAAARFKISGRSEVYSVYEAGRDGWWFHRWLRELGVDNIVVDAASIEVNRRARRAKTDRLDADKLLALLIRHHAGERVWSVLREPSVEDEDARREPSTSASGQQLPFAKVGLRDAHQASGRARSQWSGSVVHDCEAVGVLSLPNKADDEHMICALEVPERKREAVKAPGAQPIDVQFQADGR